MGLGRLQFFAYNLIRTGILFTEFLALMDLGIDCGNVINDDYFDVAAIILGVWMCLLGLEYIFSFINNPLQLFFINAVFNHLFFWIVFWAYIGDRSSPSCNNTALQAFIIVETINNVVLLAWDVFILSYLLKQPAVNHRFTQAADKIETETSFLILSELLVFGILAVTEPATCDSNVADIAIADMILSLVFVGVFALYAGLRMTRDRQNAAQKVSSALLYTLWATLAVCVIGFVVLAILGWANLFDDDNDCQFRAHRYSYYTSWFTYYITLLGLYTVLFTIIHKCTHSRGLRRGKSANQRAAAGRPPVAAAGNDFERDNRVPASNA